jgi:PHP family Zn ribbon phosphoesterase
VKVFQADLHIHTCLSPCAELDMTPRAVTARAAQLGLHMIAICDHNSAENVEAAIRAGATHGLCVLPGMEINSREEVHVLAIFEEPAHAMRMQEIVYAHLPGRNRPELFGDQVVANERDEVEGFNDRLLIGAVDLVLEDIVRTVHRLGGLIIASHVDRPRHSILTQLGFIPPELEMDGLEISRPENRDRILPACRLPVLTSSDAHFLGDVGRACTGLVMHAPVFGEVGLALAGESGRKVVP